jgi:phosphate transport system protein
MRDTYHHELERLDQDVLRMGAMVEAAIEGATLSLAEGDIERACRIMESDDDIDALFLDMEKRALSMLAQQQPVAGDLRLIVTILRVLTDLERAGDLAYNVAKITCKDLEIVKLKKVSILIYELGHASRRLFTKALDVWAAKDATMAAELDHLDDEIDQLYQELVKELFLLRDETSFEVAMNLVLVGRYFERIADHAVNMAERLCYFTSGDEAHLG